jgi:hypothetical protein
VNTHTPLAFRVTGLVQKIYTKKKPKKKQGVYHTLALPFILLTSMLWQKKNYENSNISPCKNINFKTSSKRNQSPSR